jgi:hypothetical protein
MLRSIVIACGLGVAGGCGRLDFDPIGDGGGQGDGGTSARIVPRWDVFPDGTRLQDGVYDTMLAAECTPVGIDSTVVCLPDGGAVVYGDASCTTLVGNVERVPSTTFLHSPLGQPAKLYDRGAAISQTAYYISPRPGLCQGPYTSSQLVEVGPQIDTSRFAPLMIVTDPSAGRLQPHSYATPEGLRIPIDAYDTSLAAHCHVASIAAGVFACAPDENLVVANTASDPSCTTLLATVGTGTTAPVFAQYSPFTGCQLDSVFATVGAKVAPPSPLYTTVQAPSCLTTTTSGADFYPVGTALSLSPITHAMNVNSGGRFQLGAYRGDGAAFPDPDVYDTALADTCTPRLAADGQLRCIPAGANLLDVYSDASCTTPITVAVTITESGCSPPPAPPYVLDETAATTPVYATGGVHSATVYENSGGCIPLGFGVGTVTAYDVGAAIAPTSFASLTVTWGP